MSAFMFTLFLDLIFFTHSNKYYISVTFKLTTSSVNFSFKYIHNIYFKKISSFKKLVTFTIAFLIIHTNQTIRSDMPPAVQS